MSIYDVIVMTESLRLEGVEAESERAAYKKALQDPTFAECVDVFGGECSIRFEEQEVSFVVCDFCEAELQDPEALTHAEMRLMSVGGRRQGWACQGCLEDPDGDIYPI